MDEWPSDAYAQLFQHNYIQHNSSLTSIEHTQEHPGEVSHQLYLDVFTEQK